MNIPPSGPQNARIAIVGEAPGVEEERQLKPFVGSSGRLLTQMLEANGILRDNCYITNVMKVRPPRNDFSVYYNDASRTDPKPALLQARAGVQAEIRRIKPNITILLGEEALRAITDKRGITKWRGSVLHTHVGKVIPTFHPAYILRVYSDRPIVELDFKKALRESLTPTYNPPVYDFKPNPSFEEVVNFLTTPMGRIAVDIETVGRTVRCIGIADGPRSAICIPFTASPGQISPGDTTLFSPESRGSLTSRWTFDEEKRILRLLNHLFSNPSVEKVLQNLPFDITLLATEFGFEFQNLYMDTMVAHHTCYSEMPKGLDFLASIYTDCPYYSDYDSSSDISTWTYNCYDCAVTHEISTRLDLELDNLNLKYFYHYHVHPTLYSIINAQNLGIRVDIERRDLEKTRIEKELQDAKSELTKLIGEEVNWRSPLQRKTFLYEKLRLPVQKHHKTKKATTDKNAIEKLAKRFPQHSQMFNLIRKVSDLDDTLSMSIFKDLPNGRLYTSYNVAGTVTRRLSSSSNIFGEGDNLQNIRRGVFRRMFVADPGTVLMKTDLAQAEFRLVVWLAKIHRLIQRYAKDPNFDVHTWVASMIFKKPESQVERSRSDGKPSERDTAKNGVFGGNYAMKATTAARTYKLDLEAAKFVLNAYRQAIPEIPAWWNEVQNTINTTRTIISPTGGRRIFFGRLYDDDIYRQAYSHSAQSIVSDVINRAMRLLDQLLVGGVVLLQVHDELVPQVMIKNVRRAGLLIQNVMQYPLFFPDVDTPLVIPAEVKVGPTWFDQTPYETYITSPLCTKCFYAHDEPKCPLCGSLRKKTLEEIENE
jgi:uracil-DNA glycosylase